MGRAFPDHLFVGLLNPDKMPRLIFIMFFVTQGNPVQSAGYTPRRWGVHVWNSRTASVDRL